MEFTANFKTDVFSGLVFTRFNTATGPATPTRFNSSAMISSNFNMNKMAKIVNLSAHTFPRAICQTFDGVYCYLIVRRG